MAIVQGVLPCSVIRRRIIIIISVSVSVSLFHRAIKKKDIVIHTCTSYKHEYVNKYQKYSTTATI